MWNREVLETDFAHRTRPVGCDRTHLSVRCTQAHSSSLRHSYRTLTSHVRCSLPFLHQTPGDQNRLGAALHNWSDARASVWCTKTVKNTFENSPNCASQARQGGERVPNLSLPLKLHLLHKCANTTKCTSPCVCVLTFFAIILKG
jgi:hypothetical protein